MFKPNTSRSLVEHYEEMLVRINAKNLLDPEITHGEYRTTYQIERIFVHHEYHHNASAVVPNDIALIKVLHPMNNGVQICIDGLHLNYNLFIDPNVEMAGWGNVANGGPQSNVLKRAMLYLMLNSNCGTHPQQFCAQSTGHPGAGYGCHGDSGSGLVAVDSYNQVLNILVGVYSGGGSSTSCGFPQKFANVSYYAQWINDLVGH